MIAGTTEEKRKQNYDLMNVTLDSTSVSWDDFEEFVKRIFSVYSQALSEKIEASDDDIEEVFWKIAGDDDEFDFEQYQEALDEDPTLFDWLDKPKGVMHDVLAENKDTYKREFVDRIINEFGEYLTQMQTILKRTDAVLHQYEDRNGMNIEEIEEGKLNYSSK